MELKLDRDAYVQQNKHPLPYELHRLPIIFYKIKSRVKFVTKEANAVCPQNCLVHRHQSRKGNNNNKKYYYNNLR